MIDTPMLFSAEEIGRLIAGLATFLEHQCSSLCLDSEEDRGTLAGKLAAWFAKDKTILLTPELALPKAKFHYGLNIVDEATGEHVCRLTMDRSREMTDGDFMQLQNFFWCTIGRHILNDGDLRRTLEVGGVKISVDPPTQPAPNGAMI